MPIALAQNDYLDYSSLEVTTEVSGATHAKETGTKPRIDLLLTNISFIPFTSNQQVATIESVTVNPEAQATQGSGSVLLNWENIVRERDFTYSVKTNVITNNKLKEVRTAVKFPPKNLDASIIGFTEPTKYIDINDDIRNKAIEVVGGETDFYKVVHKLAVWVEDNIDYDLTTLTADANNPSSWVLENGYGVCDELTNLYISMLRSVGIPARFAAGQAYTNIGDKFGNHGWAEVYYPNEGWIPVDIAYGQFGWLDASHVKFKEAADSGAPSADYTWKSRDIDMEFDSLKINTEITAEHPEGLETHARITLEPMKYKVGPGSYVPIQAILENPNEYYVPAKIIVKKAPKLLEKDLSKEVLLAPGESTSVFWTAIIPEDVDPKAVYSTELEVHSPQAGTADASIKFSESYEATSKLWAEEITDAFTEREEKSYFPNLDWKCSFDKEAYYPEESAKLTCKAKNTGNTDLNNIRLCLEQDCRTRNIPQGKEETAEWIMPLSNEKSRKMIVTAESDSLIRYDYPNLKIVLDPKVKAVNFNQQPIAYDEQGKLSFTLSSEDDAKNIRIIISKVGEISVPEIEGKYDIIVNYEGKSFYDGKAKMKILYQDELGKSYGTEQEFTATITNIPWHVQLLNWVNSIIKRDMQA